MLKVSTDPCPSQVLLSLLGAQFSGSWLGAAWGPTGGRSEPFCWTWQFLHKFWESKTAKSSSEAAQIWCGSFCVGWLLVWDSARIGTAELLMGLNALPKWMGMGKGELWQLMLLSWAKYSFWQKSAWPQNGKFISAYFSECWSYCTVKP